MKGRCEMAKKKRDIVMRISCDECGKRYAFTNEEINDYNTIVDKGSGLTEDLKFVKSKADELGITVQSITHEGGNIKVNCQADSYLTFREYVAALGGSEWFVVSAIPSEVYPYVQGGTIVLQPKPGE